MRVCACVPVCVCACVHGRACVRASERVSESLRPPSTLNVLARSGGRALTFLQASFSVASGSGARRGCLGCWGWGFSIMQGPWGCAVATLLCRFWGKRAWPFCSTESFKGLLGGKVRPCPGVQNKGQPTGLGGGRQLWGETLKSDRMRCVDPSQPEAVPGAVARGRTRRSPGWSSASRRGRGTAWGVPWGTPGGGGGPPPLRGGGRHGRRWKPQPNTAPNHFFSGQLRFVCWGASRTPVFGGDSPRPKCTGRWGFTKTPLADCQGICSPGERVHFLQPNPGCIMSLCAYGCCAEASFYQPRRGRGGGCLVLWGVCPQQAPPEGGRFGRQCLLT